MSIRTCIAPIVFLTLLIIVCCENDGGTAASVKASDYSGTWSGTCSVSGAQTVVDVPFQFDNLAWSDQSGLVAGAVESQFVAGAFAGTVDASGQVVGIVDNSVDGTMWTAILARTGDGISVDLQNDELAVTGQAVAVAPANSGGYKTTVKNGTSEQISLGLYTKRIGKDFLEEDVKVAPGESYTYETGGWCPMGFPPYGSFAPTDCWGTAQEYRLWFWCCCRSSSWEVRPVPVKVDGYTYKNSIVKL
jgi:hypothetical protein